MKVKQDIVYTFRLKNTSKPAVATEKDNCKQINWYLNDISCQFKNICNFVSHLFFKNNCDIENTDLKKKIRQETHDRFDASNTDINNAIKYVSQKYKDKKESLNLVNKDATISQPIRFIQPRYYVSKSQWDSIFFDKYVIFLFNIKYHGLVKLFAFNELSNYPITHHSTGLKCKYGVLIREGQKWYFHIYVNDTLEYFPPEKNDFENIVGIDFSELLTVPCFDGEDKKFFNLHTMNDVANRIIKYRTLFAKLRKKNTPASRRKLRMLKQKEKRWINNLIHCYIKEIITYYGKNTLFVIDSNFAYRAKRFAYLLNEGQYAWAISKIIQNFVYKANKNNCKVIVAEGKYEVPLWIKESRHEMVNLCSYLYCVGRKEAKHSKIKHYL